MTIDNPILNNPYREPTLHYATNPEGELDYESIVKDRRIFSGTAQTIPVRQKGQRSLFDANQVAAATHGEHLVNVLRREVRTWRDGGYLNTTRVTRELLHFWFKNEERDFTQSLFFAQQEAIEVAIFLNEIADRSNVGQRILSDLEIAQSQTGNLPRVGFKMATGTGKTVVMGALIVYHFFNRLEYRNDTRFADNFLLVAPGITIRDRLAALRVDNRTGIEAADYYHARFLIPPGQNWRREMQQLNAKLVIVNYQALQPRTLQGNKRSPFDGKIGPDGEKVEAKEDISHVIRRILSKFKSDSRLLVINDEAHHCYLPKQDDRTAEGEDAKKENERAAVWFTGLREITQRFKVRSVYDLSATPYYLTGSGHEPYTLFEWVVSDFGLIEAIESGLVKIPFLPESDDTQAIEMPVLRNLYQHVKKELPKAGQKHKRAQAKAEGREPKEEPPRIPDIVKAAFKQFYQHYEDEYKSRRHSTDARGSAQLEMDDSPPVFIVVCNNTSVSKEIYKYAAGYDAAGKDEPPQIVPGNYDLFSNFDPATLQPRTKPPTLLIDSDALENSDQIDDEFKRVFAREIELFKRDYTLRHGQGAAGEITEAEILREVVNTVGKRNALGSHIRCVVSVSMLTEGWDANTVTHIAGLRAFGSQLLCEQVAGRALRRKSYFLQGYDKAGHTTDDKRKIATYKFPPEYAHIIGVPFKLFKGGKSPPPPPVDTKRVFAIRERTDRYEITFPNIEGYRIDYPEGALTYSFDGLEDYEVDGSMLPTATIMGTGVDGSKVNLSVESVLETRDQQIIYRITKDLLRDHFSDADGNLQFHRFHQLTAIVGEWYHGKVRVLHKDAKWKKLLYFTEPKKLVTHVTRAFPSSGGADATQRIRPIFHYYNPTGSSRFVQGQTTRECYFTRHSHVNLVVIDSGWEGKAAKVLDDLADEGRVLAWVKNAFLDFSIPYTDAKGDDRDYFPDFIVRARTDAGETINLILEITGMKRDKAEKKWTVENRWLPAVNAARAKHGWERWDFMEIAEDIRDARNDILKKLGA